MINVIEKSFDVNINYVMQLACEYQVFKPSYCMFCATIWSESVAVLEKFRFGYGL